MQQTGYFAPIGLEETLRRELKDIVFEHGRLIVAKGPVQKVYFAQNIWHDLMTIHFGTISEGAKKLLEMQKLWSFYPHHHIRRGELIASKLPYFSPKPLVFPTAPKKTPLGSWTLLDANTLLASAKCSSTFSQGEVHFHETKVPPSRAYLKLWEALTRLETFPKPGDICLEIGASPGSWTWALQQLGTNVFAVDKAELDPSISKLPNITSMKKDAFSLGPEDFPKLDWIFSDVISYPEKLLSWIKKWIDANAQVKFVCTIKFQGEIDLDIIREFEKIEGSQILHLYHNKHELTWIKLV